MWYKFYSLHFIIKLFIKIFFLHFSFASILKYQHALPNFLQYKFHDYSLQISLFFFFSSSSRKEYKKNNKTNESRFSMKKTRRPWPGIADYPQNCRRTSIYPSTNICIRERKKKKKRGLCIDDETLYYRVGFGASKSVIHRMVLNSLIILCALWKRGF